MDRKLYILSLFSLAILTIFPFIGIIDLNIDEIFSGGASQNIFWNIRVPRVLSAFLAGAGLSLSGLVFQALFRNPLADPYTLGVSSGAAFGAALSLQLGLYLQALPLTSTTIMALIGAVLTVFLILTISRFCRQKSITFILLAGIIVSLFFSSLILMIQYLSDVSGVLKLSRWLLGAVDLVSFKEVGALAFFSIAAFSIARHFSAELDLASIGEEFAKSKGLDLEKTQKLILILISVSVAGIISLTGPIGFIGIIVPHAARRFAKLHRHLIPFTFLLGGVFLSLADLLARTLTQPSEVPLGVITALIGGPVFILLLLQNQKNSN